MHIEIIMEPYDYRMVIARDDVGDVISEWPVPKHVDVDKFINKIILKERLNHESRNT